MTVSIETKKAAEKNSRPPFLLCLFPANADKCPEHTHGSLSAGTLIRVLMAHTIELAEVRWGEYRTISYLGGNPFRHELLYSLNGTLQFRLGLPVRLTGVFSCG